MSYAAIGMGILLCPIRIAVIDRIPPAEPVQVRPARIPNRVPVEELARPRIIVPVGIGTGEPELQVIFRLELRQPQSFAEELDRIQYMTVPIDPVKPRLVFYNRSHIESFPLKF